MDIDPKEMAAFVVAVAGGGFALWRWMVDQKWRRVQYAQSLIKTCFENEKVIKACEILDTFDQKIRFDEENCSEGYRDIQITDKFLIEALSTFEQKEKNTEDEQAVRHVFDDFFDQLTAFQNHIDAGLIKMRDVRPYLEYWIKELTGNGKVHSAEFAGQTYKYLNYFGYNKVLIFARKMGYRFNNKLLMR
jgi:hypothetical protein